MNYEEIQMIRNSQGTYLLQRNYESDVKKIYSRHIDSRVSKQYGHFLSLNYLTYQSFINFRLLKIKAYVYMNSFDKNIYSSVYKKLLYDHENKRL